MSGAKLIYIQIKGVLNLPDDARNVGTVFITTAQHRDRPVPASATGHPDHADDINIAGLASQFRDSVDTLPNQGLKLLCGTGRLGHKTPLISGHPRARARFGGV